MRRTKQNDDLGKRGLAIVQGQAIADAWNEHTPEGTAVELIDEPVVMVEERTGGYSLARIVRCADPSPPRARADRWD